MSLVSIDEAANLVREAWPSTPDVALVLGSGLGSLEDAVEDPVRVPFERLPGFPTTGVEGHAGRFVLGRIRGVRVLIQAGRYHAYEGHDMDVVAAPVRLAVALGVRTLVVTNAAGALTANHRPGDLVLIEDQINFTARSPLVGPRRSGEQRFPDMSRPYDEALRRSARAAARELGLKLDEGVYVGVLGPSFETAAEVRMFAALGGSVVGMSTVPEVIVARAAGVRCLGISMVANMATGLGTGPVAHHEVLEVGRAAAANLVRLLDRLLPELGADGSDYARGSAK